MNEQVPMMNQQQHQQHHLMNANPNIMSMNQMNRQPQPQMVPPVNRGYGMWSQPPQFHKPNPNPSSMNPALSSFKKSLGPKSNWKGKRVNYPNDRRRKSDQMKSLISGSISGGLGGGVNIIGGSGSTSGGGLWNLNFNTYQPPGLSELQYQNQLKMRKFFSKNFYKNNMNMNMSMVGSSHNNFNNSRNAPYAPRNTTSFLIRAKKSGGIASLVSPSPMTPAVLPTPIFSPSREVLVDMAKEEWGVDGYGSMKGLIRLRSPGHEMEPNEEDEEDEGGSSESDVEEHVEVERRLDHDLSRFEMIFNPNNPTAGGMDFQSVLENRVDDQDSHIAQMEEENLILKERLFLMERELGDLRRRMQFQERKENRGGEIIDDEVVENGSENESGSRGEEGGHSMEDNNEEFSEDNTRVCERKGGDGHYSESETAGKNEGICFENGVEKKFDVIDEDGEGCNKACDPESKGENNKDDEFVDPNNKNNDVYDLGKEAANNDDMVAKADENSIKVVETGGKEHNNDEPIDLDKIEGNNKVVKESDENNNHEENKYEDMEVKYIDSIDTESSEPVVEDGDSM